MISFYLVICGPVYIYVIPFICFIQCLYYSQAQFSIGESYIRVRLPLEFLIWHTNLGPLRSVINPSQTVFLDSTHRLCKAT